jgi:hypothetical protein
MPRTHRLLLELEAGSGPLSGRIGPESGPGLPFLGYTQLIAAIDATLTAGQLPDPAEERHG